jgi:hypothetical protein
VYSSKCLVTMHRLGMLHIKLGNNDQVLRIYSVKAITSIFLQDRFFFFKSLVKPEVSVKFLLSSRSLPLHFTDLLFVLAAGLVSKDHWTSLETCSRRRYVDPHSNPTSFLTSMRQWAAGTQKGPKAPNYNPRRTLLTMVLSDPLRSGGLRPRRIRG